MSSVHAASVELAFTRITNNNVEDVASQLSVTIYDSVDALMDRGVTIAADQVLFTVENHVDGGIASNIAEFYIDDGTIVSGPTVLNSLGGGTGNFTDFVGGTATPEKLPGRNNVSPAFDASSSFSADVDNGPAQNGVNTGSDVLGLVYNFSGNFQDIIVALNLPTSDPNYTTDSLRVGLHVRSIGVAEDSDSFVNNPPNGPPLVVIPVPLPAAAWMGIMMLGGLGAIKKVHGK